MLRLFAAFAVPLVPLVLIMLPLALLMWVQTARDRRLRERLRRQVMLTDAIHKELGPVVAPIVRRPIWGPWQVEIAVPFGRPALVCSVLSLAQEALAAAAREPYPYRIVLTPQEEVRR